MRKILVVEDGDDTNHFICRTNVQEHFLRDPQRPAGSSDSQSRTAALHTVGQEPGQGPGGPGARQRPLHLAVCFGGKIAGKFIIFRRDDK